MTEFKRAFLVIRDATPPGHAPGERPWLGCGPDSVFGVPAQEKERIAREGGKASLLLSKATQAQARLLQRLAVTAPDRALRFPSIETLERFLKATASLSDAEAIALADDALKKLWDGIAAATSAPTDYELVTEQEVDYGGGRVRMGVRNGVPFEEPIKPKRRAARSKRST